MPYQLVVVRGRSSSPGLRIPGEGVTTVGRQQGCQIRISSSQVSRKHCELYVDSGRLIVKDLNSSNGTLVDGRRIEGRQAVEPGSLLTIGSIVFRVEATAPVAVPVSHPSGRPGETAVALPVSASQEEELDFEIEADSETQVISPSAAAKSAATTPVRPQPIPPSARPESVDADAPQELDEADVAGFLLDLDVDEDDKR